MIWIMVAALALLVFVALVFVLKAPRPGWEAIGMALFLGIAGYAWQANPGLPGKPTTAKQEIAGDPASLVDARRSLKADGAAPANNWVVVADAMVRNGQFANAVSLLNGEVEDHPDNADAWLAMANALVGHADGLLTPAALHAYRRAAAADPKSPGPPFFLGLAYASAGRLTEARGEWAGLLSRSAPDAPWRPELAARLGELDRFIAAQQGGVAAR